MDIPSWAFSALKKLTYAQVAFLHVSTSCLISQ